MHFHADEFGKIYVIAEAIHENPKIDKTNWSLHPCSASGKIPS
jgi:hypothetical protein